MEFESPALRMNIEIIYCKSFFEFYSWAADDIMLKSNAKEMRDEIDNQILKEILAAEALK